MESDGVMRSELPIGVFDSGVGGLTVMRAIHELLPQEHLLYLGDTARVPYGTRSPHTVERYAERVAGHLVRRGIKALVVACNTATTYALGALQEQGARRGIPVIGVIEPGVNEALNRTPSGRIGVIGTEGTIRGQVYAEQLCAKRADVDIHMVACPLFVALAEEGWTDGEVAQIAAARYLDHLNGAIDSLILGCTHYPLLTSAIEGTLPRVRLIDSASATAGALRDVLTNAGIARRQQGQPGDMRFLVTDNLARFRDVGVRFLGADPAPVELVDLDEVDAAVWSAAEVAS
jgi:glutamate racemase